MKTNISGFDIEGTPAEIYEFIQLGLKSTTIETETTTIKPKGKIGRPRKYVKEKIQIEHQPQKEHRKRTGLRPKGPKTPIMVFAVSPTGEEVIFGSICKAAKAVGCTQASISDAFRTHKEEYRKNGWLLKVHKGDVGDIKFIPAETTKKIKVELTDTKGNTSVVQSIKECAERIGIPRKTLNTRLMVDGIFRTSAWTVKPYIPTHSNQL